MQFETVPIHLCGKYSYQIESSDLVYVTARFMKTCQKLYSASLRYHPIANIISFRSGTDTAHFIKIIQGIIQT